MLNSNEKILFSELKTNLKNLKIVNKNYVYYWTKTKWNKELQHSIDDRCCIGKKLMIILFQIKNIILRFQNLLIIC